ncbi:protein disulfide isomerase4 [Zea mays]|uniref:Protein disulfide isomerase4 n=1 Tax=Zea mays TaxID=4577 RepID=A0A1D6GXM8_MAIZE|nr:protein disulfide isomerase4 [Zea mays]
MPPPESIALLSVWTVPTSSFPPPPRKNQRRVAGGASSGKSTVCKMIIDQLRDQRVVAVTQESFYYGLTDEELVHVHDYNFDHPDAFHTELLLSCMQNLKHGKAVDIPNYNFKTYKSVPNARKVIF